MSHKFIKLILLLILASLILFYKVNKPFLGYHDWNSVVYSNITRNYVRYGFIKPKLGQVKNFDSTKTYTFSYLTHYPPLLPILMSASFFILGISEMSARLVPILLSLLLLVNIYPPSQKTTGHVWLTDECG